MPLSTLFRKSIKQITRLIPDEIRARATQEITKRLDVVLYGLGIKAGSRVAGVVTAAPGRFFFEASELPDLVTLLRDRLPHEAELILEEAEGICRHRFNLLGYSDLDYGAEIDWHCDAR